MRRIVLFLIAAALAWGADGGPPFFFIQMSDPQFGMYAKDANFAQETANFEFAIATANRLKPAFVIVTGDLINKTRDAAQTAEYKRIAAKLDPAIRLYNVAGNHDVGNEPTQASLAAYRERFGPDYYVFRQGDMAGIVLNSSVIAAPKNVPDEAEKQKPGCADALEEGARRRRQTDRRLHAPLVVPEGSRRARPVFQYSERNPPALPGTVSPLRGDPPVRRPLSPERVRPGQRYRDDHHRPGGHAAGRHAFGNADRDREACRRWSRRGTISARCRTK